MARPRSAWLAVGAALLGLLWGGGLISLSLAGVAGDSAVSGLTGVQTVERRAMGPTNAPVQIELYYDFQCGHCESLHRGAEAEIVRRYVATGKAHLEARPLPFLGPESQRAAEAAACAADQTRYWEYRDALFSTWRRYGPATYSLPGLIEIAGQVGLNLDAFGDCLTSGARSGEVEADLQEARTRGVRAVPVVFINGRKMEGALPFERYASVIEEVLAR